MEKIVAKDWKEKMPEVPSNVHMAVLSALDSLGEEPFRKEERPVKRHKNMRTMMLAAVLAAAMMGMTAFAAELIWNSQVTEAFQNPPAELQQKTLDNGVASMQNVSAAEQGITVTAVQTLQDENRVYLLLRVESEEPILDGRAIFEKLEFCDGLNPHIGTHDIFNNIGSGFVGVKDGQPVHTAYYYVDGLKNMDTHWNGGTLQVTLSDFHYENEQGKGESLDTDWNLEVSLTDASDLSRTLEVNKDFDYDGVPVTIHSVTVSPLSIIISYDREDCGKIPVAEDDTLQLFFFRLLDKEGNVMVKEGDFGGVSARYTENEIVMQMGLTGVVDVEQLGQIVLGDGTVTVEVP